MKYILFVDDDPNVLESFQEMLASRQNVWKMDFASNARQAFELMSHQTYNTIVVDMHMPGISGYDLLEWARQYFPQITRIAITGHIDSETSYQAIAASHQFLAKPIRSKVLLSTLDRASVLQELLWRDDIKRLISQLKTLPSLPLLYLEIFKELQSQHSTAKSVGQIIAKDPGMSTKILQVVNSAFMGLSSHVNDPSQATTLLGIETIRDLAVTIHVFSQFSPVIQEKLGISSLWEHSINVGTLARAIARFEGAKKEVVECSFTAGLLHDLGKLILAENLPMQYYSALGLSARKNIELYQAESEIFGATHPQVGAYLTGLWGLPQMITIALAYHHNPAESCESVFNPTLAVHVANVLEHETNPRRWGKVPPKLDMEYITAIKMDSHLPDWRNLVQDVIQKEKK
jgi:HD-like signal output (HDOD) protein/CheY-like chemotaxis protein